MKRTGFLMLSVAAVAVAAFLAQRAAADDETDELEIKIQAPLGAAACDAAPPTITVLGLTIGISAATFEGEDHGSGASQGADDDPEDEDGQGPAGCAALVPGQVVEVKLASDAVPLAATAVGQKGSDAGELEIKAPIQAVDATAKTITVLGLKIDVSGARLDGADDKDDDANNQPIDLSQLMAGQFVEVKLAPGRLPALAATELEVKNFTNQVRVEVDDANGKEVEDEDDDGAEIDDVDVSVTEFVVVRNSAAGTGGSAALTGPRRVRKVLQFHQATNGSFVLGGLPTGLAKIVVTRVVNGVATGARRGILVRGNVTRTFRVRLRPTLIR